MMKNRKKTYYSKTIEDIKQINKKRGRNTLQLIDKFGMIKAYDILKKRGTVKNTFPRRCSKISICFFDKLRIELNEDFKLLYGVNDEKWIRLNKNKGTFVDLIVDNTNKIIEFNGDFFHANPIKYNKNDIIKIAENCQFKAKDIWEKDFIKNETLKEKGYDVLTIWENDVIKNCNQELNKCIEFIKK
jgi:hypothetical protein